MGLQFPTAVCRNPIVTALVLLLASSATPQAGQEQQSVDIVLPSGVPSEKVHIDYVLEGPFGAYGNLMRPVPGVATYRISPYVSGRRASQIKGFIWASGCEMMTFDDFLVDSVDLQEFFLCSPLGTVTLVGRIHGAPLSRKPVEVRVDYLATWACNFFGFADCIVPQIEVGRVKPDANGAFEMELPDFAADSVASGSEGGAELQFVLSEVKGNSIAFLAPETEALRTITRGLKIVPSYPQNLVFSTRKVE